MKYLRKQLENFTEGDSSRWIFDYFSTNSCQIHVAKVLKSYLWIDTGLSDCSVYCSYQDVNSAQSVHQWSNAMQPWASEAAIFFLCGGASWAKDSWTEYVQWLDSIQLYHVAAILFTPPMSGTQSVSGHRKRIGCIHTWLCTSRRNSDSKTNELWFCETNATMPLSDPHPVKQSSREQRSHSRVHFQIPCSKQSLMHFGPSWLMSAECRQLISGVPHQDELPILEPSLPLYELR